MSHVDLPGTRSEDTSTKSPVSATVRQLTHKPDVLEHGNQEMTARCVDRARALNFSIAAEGRARRLSKQGYRSIYNSDENDATRYWAIALHLGRDTSPPSRATRLRGHEVLPGSEKDMAEFGGLLPWEYAHILSCLLEQ